MTVQLPPELEKQLDEAASQARISKDELVRDVLMGYLEEIDTLRAIEEASAQSERGEGRPAREVFEQIRAKDRIQTR